MSFIKRFIGLILIAGLAFGGWDCSSSREFSVGELHRALTQEKFWLNTSRSLTAEDLAGRILLVDFWTYCCINCMHVIPELQQLEKEFGHDLAVIGVHSAKFDNEKETANIRSAVLRYGIEHPVVNDADFKIWDRFTVKVWPTLVLIDPEGKVDRVYSGEGHLQELRADIARLRTRFATRYVTSPLPLALEKGKAADAPLKFPGKLAQAPELDLFFVSDSSHHRLLAFKSDGSVVFEIGKKGEAGSQDGGFVTARFKQPQGLLYREGRLYVADTGNHLLRQVDLVSKQVTTLAGTGTQGFERKLRDAPALQTSLSSPWDLAFYPSPNEVAIAMAGTHQIWSYDLAKKTLNVLAGNGRESIVDGPYPQNALSQPSGLSVFQDRLYFVDSETSSLRVLQNGQVETLLGSGLFDFGFKDGAKAEAKLQHPLGVFADDSGIYIADSYNHALRRYDPKKKTLETLVGDGKPGAGQGALSQTRLDEPNGLLKVGEKWWVTDTNNQRILSIDLTQGRTSEVVLQFAEPRAAPQLATHLPNLKASPAQTLKAGVPIPLHIELEVGWKINAQAPSHLRLFRVEGEVVVLEKAFSKEEILQKKLLLPFLATGANYRLQGTLYFCREGAESLCYLQSVDQTISAAEVGLDALSIVLRKEPRID